MSRARVLDDIARGKPSGGPLNVHVDITNACNAACITCWDHSPLLAEPRPSSWKQRRMAHGDFTDLVEQLDAIGSVEALILSGMGDPLVHPDVYEMIAAVKARGWHLTVLTNLVAADIDRLEASGVDQLLVGVHGVTPRTYLAFHPGWTERHFSSMCRMLRRLRSAGVRTRHVHVINRDTAPELVEMVRFGRSFGAQRVNFKLASLFAGTEACSVTKEQLDWLLGEGVPQARVLADELSVPTNLDLFEQQLRAAAGEPRATTPIEEVGCFMGYVYTRVTVDREVLYCCNTNVRVGSLQDSRFVDLWYGEAWQSLRSRFRRGHYMAGCDKCGKFEQNVKYSHRYRRQAGEQAWRDAIGAGAPAAKLRVIA